MEFSLEGCGFARVWAVDRGSYLIKDAAREVPAELAGKLAYQSDRSVDLPCVGDWVTAQYHNHDTAAIIHRVFPRKTFLRRKAPGKNIDFQMIAANIDTAFIVQSCHFDFNPSRLDRYLIMATDGQVEPVVLLTKTDLISPAELDQKLALLRSVTTARVMALSNLTGSGFDELQQTLSAGKTYCLLGSSGVGKTTLINRLLGEEALETRAVSSTGEGTHTTSRRQLVVLSQGAMLIDTPGMRELGIAGAGEGGVTIDVPAEPLDSLDTVVVLEVKGKLDIEKTLPGQEANGTMSLPVPLAEIHGDGAQVEEKGGQPNIGYWTNARDWLSWQFKLEKGGRFNVMATFATTASSSKFDVAVGEQKFTAQVERTGSYETFKTVKLGEVWLEPGTHELSLKPVRDQWQAINLRSVVLKPAN